ncbi:MAG TPA: hypothetical protein VFQ09_08830 [Rubrobacter sp.]|nr:hypothetical protein [Rubrobacter sp.]
MSEHEGEYWQPALQPEVHPDDRCGCVKPPGYVGMFGWHFNPKGVAVARCPAYLAAVKRNGRRRRR